MCHEEVFDLSPVMAVTNPAKPPRMAGTGELMGTQICPL